MYREDDPRTDRSMLLTVKSREIQRALTAEMSGQSAEARRHFLAAAHLELVAASDYADAGDAQLSRRSRISAASCLWRAGSIDQAQSLLDELKQSDPSRSDEIQAVVDELAIG